jgi:predicted AlkP superfamily pyrophosphatase or phosphodiesterase
VILLDDYLDPSSVQLDFDASVAGLRPVTGDVESMMRALAPLQHGKAYRTADLPARFHITANARNPAVWIVPDEGWEIYFRSRFNAYRPKFNKGDHGYDPAFPSMRGILIAHGPSFKTGGVVLDEVENVHIYNLLCAALGLTPAPNDGDDRLVRAILK